MNRIRLGLVGLGYWGMNYLRVLTSLPFADLIVCCDRDKNRLQRSGLKNSDVKLTGNLDDLILSEDLEAIVVSTPASTHFEIGKRALEHGKHVLVEKPTAISFRDAKELHALASRNSLVLMTGLVYRFHPAIVKLKKLLHSGMLGDVRYVHCERLGLGPIREDVNVVLDLAPHDVSIILELLERGPREVTMLGRAFLRSSIEDVAFGILSFDDTVAASLNVSWLEPIKIRKVTLVCDEKTVVFDDVSPFERLNVYDSSVAVEAVTPESYGEFRLKVRQGDMVSLALPAEEPLRAQCSEFIKRIQTGSAESTAEFELLVMQTLEAMTESVSRGQPIIVDKIS